MRVNADYLVKSRHGIWYYRWVVPGRLRALHPGLPKELKRSTRTADTRLARRLARAFHLDHLRRLHTSITMDLPLGPELRQFIIDLDPKTGRPVRVQAEPHEANEAAAACEQLMRAAIAREMARPSPGDSIEAGGAATPARSVDEKPKDSPGSAPEPAAQPVPAGEKRTVGDAFAKYATQQLTHEVWSEQTLRFTHEPSIRVFMELIGRPMQRIGKDGAVETVYDLPLSELTAEVVEAFVEEFAKFPSRQGKRPQTEHARKVLEAGGPPQPLDNYFKRLEHVRQFLAFCLDKKYITEQTLREVTLITKQNTVKRRKKAAAQQASNGMEGADGYVAFTDVDLKRLFGPAFGKHVKGRAARYWIPLLGLYTGMRVGEISQLRPDDFEVREGIPCVVVRSNVTVATSADGGVTQTRLKTGAASRVLPLHPALTALGLQDYLATRRKEAKAWMWDGLIWEQKSGFGRYPSRDFMELAKEVDVHVPKRKVFHSFRSTLAQALEEARLEGQLIDRFIGHEVRTTRKKHYNRTETGQAFPVKRVAEVLEQVTFPIEVPRWMDQQPRRHARARPCL